MLGVASTEYAFETPQPLWSEQDPGLWWRGSVMSIREVMAKPQLILGGQSNWFGWPDARVGTSG